MRPPSTPSADEGAPGSLQHVERSLEGQVVPWNEVDDEQILNSLDRLSPKGRRKAVARLLAGADALDRTITALQPRLIELARQRGLDWTGLSDEEREHLVDDVLHD